MSSTLQDIFGYGKIRTLPKTKLPTSKYEDSTLSDQLIGIEVEVEGIHNLVTPLRYWELIDDGSLRNHGFEFRTPAFPLKFVATIIGELYQELATSNPQHDFSERTSIHVHFDFRQKTTEDIFKLYLLYAMCEPCLFEFSSPQRKQSTFCIPLKDSLRIDAFHNYLNILKKDGFIGSGLIMSCLEDLCPGKYSALNLRNLANSHQGNRDGGAAHTGCGSIEFRHLEGTADYKKVTQWVKLLNNLIESASELSMQEIEGYAQNLNTTSEYSLFLQRVFKRDWQAVIPQPYTIKFFSEGVSLAKTMLASNKQVVSIDNYMPSPLIYALQKRISPEEAREPVELEDILADMPIEAPPVARPFIRNIGWEAIRAGAPIDRWYNIDPVHIDDEPEEQGNQQ